MAGLTYAVVKDYGDVSIGNFRGRFVDITMDNSYPTGGYTASAAALAMRALYGLAMIGGNTASAGYVAVYNKETGKLQVFSAAAFTPAGTISAPTITMPGGGAGGAVTVNPDATGGALTHAAAGTITGVTGVQAPTFTGSAVAAAVMPEVANGVNLATVVVRALALGD